MTRKTKELIAWSVALFLTASLFLDELIGIMGWLGAQPITVVSVKNPFLAGIILGAFPIAAILWIIHLNVNRNKNRK